MAGLKGKAMGGVGLRPALVLSRPWCAGRYEPIWCEASPQRYSMPAQCRCVHGPLVWIGKRTIGGQVSTREKSINHLVAEKSRHGGTAVVVTVSGVWIWEGASLIQSFMRRQFFTI